MGIGSHDETASSSATRAAANSEQPRFRFEPWPGEPTPVGLFATILHVTDLHLDRSHRGPARRERVLDRLVELNGAINSVATRLVVEFVRSAGLVGSEEAWSALVRFLEDLISWARADDGNNVVVAHTGDAEAFGADEHGNHPAYEEMHTEFWPRFEAGGAVCIDVFGNHDVWPNVLLGNDFAQEHTRGAYELATEHARLMGPWSSILIDAPGASTIEVHRVNTVETSVLAGAFLAQGRVGNEPHPDGSTLQAVAARIADRFEKDPAHLHLVLTHHPLYQQPEPGLADRAKVRDAEALRAVLGNKALVISGHLHRIEPPPDTSSTHPQLVSDAPVLRRHLDESRSFAEYSLLLRPGRDGSMADGFAEAIRVDRTVYRYSRSQEFVELGAREPDILPATLL